MNESLNNKRQRTERDERKQFQVRSVPGSLLHVQGFPEDMKVSTIKASFEEAGHPARFVEMNPGSQESNGKGTCWCHAKANSAMTPA